jgi:hypothetical protein
LIYASAQPGVLQAASRFQDAARQPGRQAAQEHGKGGDPDRGHEDHVASLEGRAVHDRDRDGQRDREHGEERQEEAHAHQA